MGIIFQIGSVFFLAALLGMSPLKAEESKLVGWQNSAQKTAESDTFLTRPLALSSDKKTSLQMKTAEGTEPFLSQDTSATPRTETQVSSSPTDGRAAEPPRNEIKTETKVETKTEKEAASSPQGDVKIDKRSSAAANTPAKKLFGSVKIPVAMQPRAIGFYTKGCLAGAKPLAIDGPSWQAMRLSRNRNWGHPKLIALLERYANDVQTKDGWPGLLIGDISQPRGGPMITGHASHQLGLDADIWFTPMPSRRLTTEERENLAAISMLTSDSLSVNPKVWGEGQVKIVRRVASYPEVERVLVHPAIKKALCQAAGQERGWLSKVRPYWGHFYHYHVRIGCPSDSVGCLKQDPIPGDDGCGDELKHWYKLLTAPASPKPTVPVKPEKPKPPLMLADLPSECNMVLNGRENVQYASKSPQKKIDKPTAAQPAISETKKTEAASN
ncbi:MAG: penicillin-insensitive murein endopeptidase [Hyphomicrobium sp.]